MDIKKQNDRLIITSEEGNRPLNIQLAQDRQTIIDEVGYTAVSTIILRSGILKPTEFAVYVMIRSYTYDGGAKKAWPSQETLAKHCNCSIKTIQNSLASLVKHGLITKKRTNRWKTNRYYLNEFPIAFVENALKNIKFNPYKSR